MQFRLEVNPATLPLKINHGSRILMMGSCFAENIGDRFRRARFDALLNTHGILFNPYSIAVALDDLAQGKTYRLQDLVECQGKWVSMSHHGRFSNSVPDAALSHINTSIEEGSSFLRNADVLIITFGSAWSWEYLNTGKIAANCHKIPQQAFKKVLLTHPEIEDRYSILIAGLKKINPRLQVIITVSPVRYLRDTLEGNNISKSHLLLAAHSLANSFEDVHYFPAYELVVDDLRDYRFYNDDMLHPSPVALQYVWSKFCESCMDKLTLEKTAAIEKQMLVLEHRQTGSSTNALQIKKQAEMEIRRILDHDGE